MGLTSSEYAFQWSLVRCGLMRQVMTTKSQLDARLDSES